MTVITHAAVVICSVFAPLQFTNLYCFLVSYLPAFVSRIFVANTRTMFTNRIKLSWKNGQKNFIIHGLWKRWAVWIACTGDCQGFFFLFFFYYWKFLHPFSYSFINLCIQKLLGILQTEHSEPCQIWNTSIIFITVIWHFSRKSLSSCRIRQRPCTA